MKPLFRLCWLGLPLLTMLPAHAAFSPEVVGADARWVLHADFNALRDSVLGRELIEKAEELQTGALQGVVNVDVPKVFATIGAITAYGSNLATDPKLIDGTLVIQGTADLGKIVESLLLQANLADPSKVKEVTDLPFPAYAIASGEAGAEAQSEVIIAFPPEPVVLISKSRPQLLKARDVMANPAQSLGRAGDTPLARLLGGTRNAFLFAASVVPSSTLFPENAPQARILQMASSAALAFGENGPDTFAHAELKATSEELAVKLAKILEGMTAMLSLAETTNENLSQFINSTRVARSGDIVTLDLAYPSLRVLEMIGNLGSQNPAADAEPEAIVRGTVVARWTAESEAATASAETLSVRTIENVRLENGATLSLGARRNDANVRIDRVEIAPVAGGMPLVFRAEHMRLQGFRPDAPALGSDGRLIRLRDGQGTARLVFPGVAGNYTVRIAYVNEPGSRAAYEVGVQTGGSPGPAGN